MEWGAGGRMDPSEGIPRGANTFYNIKARKEKLPQDPQGKKTSNVHIH
jgi:hypothetical protein